MIKIKDLVRLNDGKEYCVASKTIFEGNTYYFLVDMDDVQNIKICCEKLENNTIKLIQIEDSGLLDKLMISFAESNK